MDCFRSASEGQAVHSDQLGDELTLLGIMPSLGTQAPDMPTTGFDLPWTPPCAPQNPSVHPSSFCCL